MRVDHDSRLGNHASARENHVRETRALRLLAHAIFARALVIVRSTFSE